MFDYETVYVLNFTDSELIKNNESQISFKLALNTALITTNENVLNKYNFTIKTIIIDVDEYLNGFNSILKSATSLETMILIDLVKINFDSRVIFLNQFTNETWFWDFPKIRGIEFKSFKSIVANNFY